MFHWMANVIYICFMIFMMLLTTCKVHFTQILKKYLKRFNYYLETEG